MRNQHLWNQAKSVQIQTSMDIVGGFDIGFDKGIPEETKNSLMDFVYWVEDHFNLPVTLWVDFKYNHYLIDTNKRRVPYRFYWADFISYPEFKNPDDIPVIELAVRTQHSKIEEILLAFIAAISMYFHWLTNENPSMKEPNIDEVNEVFRLYLNRRTN